MLPGLVKTRLISIRSIIKGTKLMKTIHDVMCHPHSVTLPD